MSADPIHVTAKPPVYTMAVWSCPHWPRIIDPALIRGFEFIVTGAAHGECHPCGRARRVDGVMVGRESMKAGAAIEQGHRAAENDHKGERQAYKRGRDHGHLHHVASPHFPVRALIAQVERQLSGKYRGVALLVTAFSVPSVDPAATADIQKG